LVFVASSVGVLSRLYALTRRNKTHAMIRKLTTAVRNAPYGIGVSFKVA
jgi:hypothetical protein